MAAASKNVHDMPIPSFGYPDRHGGRVYAQSIEEDGKSHKRTIGYMTVSTPGSERMIPSPYFKTKFQDLYMEAYPDATIPFHEMNIGMYALTLGIGTRTGLYTDLQDVYGPVYANNILDYCMFTILHRSDVTRIYEKSMLREVLFCDTLHTDSWYSNFFSKKITEDEHHQFRIKWIKRLVARGLKKVWLSIDGSNNDCEARQSFLAKFGFPESHNTNRTGVGCMYVVDAQTGRPVTYFVYEGIVPDAQAFETIATFLKSADLEIEGVILDCGFAVENVFDAIEKMGWNYVIMLPNDIYAHTQMVKDFGEAIRWKSEYVLNDEALFGIDDVKKLFGNNDRTSAICLFFDGAGGSSQSIQLIKQIQCAKKGAEDAIADGRSVAIEGSLKQYLAIEGESFDRKVVVKYASWDASMSENGFHSMAVSEGINPNRANRLYKMRDVFETQYSVLTSQEGGHTTRVHKTAGVYSKFAMLFVSSLIRFEIENACQKLDLDTNLTIQGMEHIALLYTSKEKYEAVRNLSTDQKALFAEFDMDQDDMERLAREFNSRSRSDSKNPNRTLPEEKTPVFRNNTHKRGRQPNDSGSRTNTDSTKSEMKSKGGRPLGKRDSRPRKPRSDKGRKRGPRIQNQINSPAFEESSVN